MNALGKVVFGILRVKGKYHPLTPPGQVEHGRARALGWGHRPRSPAQDPSGLPHHGRATLGTPV